LPKEKQYQYTGLDWLLLLLKSVEKVVVAQVLLFFWRAWHLRNDIGPIWQGSLRCFSSDLSVFKPHPTLFKKITSTDKL
jgi:hypothetical protein